MSLMERTRELGADDARIEEITVAAARGALMREIVQGTPARRRLPLWAPVGIGGMVAGTAVAAVVIGSVIAPGAAPSASASEVLTDAAQLTVRAGEMAVSAGKYLRITSNRAHCSRGCVLV